jgi:osmotically-inducible protein OsmY
MVRALIIVAAAFVAGCQSYHDGSGKTVGEVTDDRAIHARIKYALWDDEELSGWSINVDVELGAVALYGPGAWAGGEARARPEGGGHKGGGGGENPRPGG